MKKNGRHGAHSSAEFAHGPPPRQSGYVVAGHGGRAQLFSQIGMIRFVLLSLIYAENKWAEISSEWDLDCG